MGSEYASSIHRRTECDGYLVAKVSSDATAAA